MFLLSNHRNQEENRTELSDISIIKKYQESLDTSLVGELFHRYTHLVFAVCIKYLKNQEDAKDAVMQIFEDLLEKLKTHQIENFKSWLHSVAKNHCLMKLRSSKREVELFEEYSEKKSELVMEFEEELHLNNKYETEQKYELLHKVIKELKEEQSICIRLMYIENKSYKEISEITGYDLKKVKSHIQNGKRNLKMILSSYYDE